MTDPPVRPARYVVRRALHGFLRHRGLDSAAALSLFSAIAFFPMTLAAVSAFAIGTGRAAAPDEFLSLLGEVLQPQTVETLRAPLTQLFTIGNPWLGLVLGLTLATWSLSAYATGFGRAVNAVYEVQEGRPIWRFRGTMLLLALVLMVVFAALYGLLLSTPAVVEELDVPEPWRTIWNLFRWPLLLVIVGLQVALLYYATPAVKHERFRWVSPGALVAIVAWALATAGFAAYVSLVQGYDRIYGWLGGGLVLLLWLYLTNLTLVLGAEVDAEITRLRQLRAGLAAEEVLQAPMRDTRRNLMLARQRAQDVADARAIRERANS